MHEWLQEHIGTVTAAVVSAGLCGLGFVGSVILVVRLPVDFLRRVENDGIARRAWDWKRVLRNIIGWGMIAAGLAMMVLPGPGVAALLLGVGMADFPGKQAVLKWLITRDSVAKSMNRLRTRFGKPPLSVESG